jgi:ABC-type sugar transport system ATPase subunit
MRTIQHWIAGSETAGADTPVNFSSPREALERGISTVYQDLAVVHQTLRSP